MKKYVLIPLISTLFLTSCFKTAEEIKRDQQVDIQLQQSAKIIADLTSQVNELKGSLANTSGQLEEIDYKNQQNKVVESESLSKQIEELRSQITVLKSQLDQQKKDFDNLKSNFNKQNKYIKKVNKTLKTMGSNDSGSKNLLQAAHKAFEKNQQKKALELYQEVLGENKISAAQRNHVYYNIGLLNFWKKDYNETLIYMSKIYTKYPRSSFASKSLFYIGKAFKAQGKNDEAQATFSELIQKYPKSSQATAAKKEVK